MRQRFRRVKELRQFTIRATDGDVGTPEEIFFDDETWAVRYLVVNTGSWLTGRRVLIAPMAVSDIDDSEQILQVNLTRRQVEASPTVDTEKPISRQYEEEYYKHYEWTPYWGSAMGAEAHMPPSARTLAKSVDAEQVPTGEIEESHLRSSAEVTGYYIEARDGEIGHVEDFVVDHKDWSIGYLEVDTRNWWPGKKVLVSPTWIEGVNWEDRKVLIDLNREVIEGAPDFDSSGIVTEDYELELFKYYGQRRGKTGPSA
jgi:hypothetical protein